MKSRKKKLNPWDWYITQKKKTKYNAQCPRQPNIWKIRLKKKLKKEKKIGLVKSKIEKKN